VFSQAWTIFATLQAIQSAGLDANVFVLIRGVGATNSRHDYEWGGNPEFTNLPRKFNIAISGGHDNSFTPKLMI